MNTRKLITLMVTLSVVLSVVSCQRTISRKPLTTISSTPDVTDIYNPAVGAFLDVDLRQLTNEANEAYQAEDYELAVRRFLELLQYNISDGTSIYNLACCYGLLGKGELAAHYLERAVKAGFDNVSYIEIDTDFDKVRETEEFQATIDRLKEVVNKTDDEKGELIFLSGGGCVQGRIHFPEGYDSAKSYPLVLGLHGFGDTFENFTYQWKRFENPQFIYVALQAPYAFYNGNSIAYTWNISVDDRPDLVKETVKMTIDLIADVVQQLQGDYSINSKYLLGFSQGSFFALSTGIQNSEQIDGVVCFGGWLDADVLDEGKLVAGKSLKVFLGHGSDDKVIPHEAAETAQRVLANNGYIVTLETFEGGHTIKTETLNSAIRWLGLR